MPAALTVATAGLELAQVAGRRILQEPASVVAISFAGWRQVSNGSTVIGWTAIRWIVGPVATTGR